MTKYAYLALLGLVQAISDEEKVASLPDMADFDEYGLYSGYVNIPDT